MSSNNSNNSNNDFMFKYFNFSSSSTDTGLSSNPDNSCFNNMSDLFASYCPERLLHKGHYAKQYVQWQFK